MPIGIEHPLSTGRTQEEGLSSADIMATLRVHRVHCHVLLLRMLRCVVYTYVYPWFHIFRKFVSLTGTWHHCYGQIRPDIWTPNPQRVEPNLPEINTRQYSHPLNKISDREPSAPNSVQIEYSAVEERTMIAWFSGLPLSWQMGVSEN